MNDAPVLELQRLSVAYNEKPVVWNVSLSVPSGSLTAVVGPNGAGKSTLIKAALGLTPVLHGKALFFGKPLGQVRKKVAYVPQRSEVDWDFPTNALDVVEMGLYGQLGWFRRPSKRERTRALECLERVKMQDFAHRQIAQLSGGQKQRVFLARALAQEADLMLMDEPFAGVDMLTEQAILEVLRELRDQGRSVMVVHHDLETVREYFDHVILLNRELVATGDITSTFTQDNITATYGSAHARPAGGL